MPGPSSVCSWRNGTCAASQGEGTRCRCQQGHGPKKKAQVSGAVADLGLLAAEGVGFEPTEPGGSTVFETVRFGRSRIPPAEKSRTPAPGVARRRSGG